MQNVATIFKGTISEQAKTSCGDFSFRIALARFRLFIKTTDWDKGYLLNGGIDSLCRYLLAAAFICFLYPLVLIFIR
ncbi:MAG: hypothetical protein M0P74_03310 [Syntrophales bacterium]|jgi:hypothetical protein|nr:hypothetical protein [Syntrophales bacterium]